MKVYYQLDIPSFKWAGLKSLPAVAPHTDSGTFRSVVRSLIAVLDSELAASMPAPISSGKARARSPPLSPHAASVVVPDDLWDGLLMMSSDDEEESSHEKSLPLLAATENEALVALKNTVRVTTDQQPVCGDERYEKCLCDDGGTTDVFASEHQKNADLGAALGDALDDSSGKITDIKNGGREADAGLAHGDDSDRCENTAAKISEALQRKRASWLKEMEEEKAELESDVQWERRIEAQQAEYFARNRRQQAIANDDADDESSLLLDSPSAREARAALEEVMKRIPQNDQNKVDGHDHASALSTDGVPELSSHEHWSETNACSSDGNENCERTGDRKLDSRQLQQSARRHHDGPVADDERPKTCSSAGNRGIENESSKRLYDVSPLAVAALWELLCCCLGARLVGPKVVAKNEEASLQEMRPQATHGQGKVDKLSCTQTADKYCKDLLGSSSGLCQQGPSPCLRWYDARARVALKTLCGWLQVPLRKLITLEVLLGSDKTADKMLAKRGDVENAVADHTRYLKVGLAALGGGALFAVTGGLAAPAIAAGVGSILGIVPGAGAAAGAVAGFMSTSAGVAAVTTTMATAGAATTGTRMANRTAEVKDFGFVHLKELAEVVDVGMFERSSSSTSTSSAVGKDTDQSSDQRNTCSDAGHLMISARSFSQGKEVNVSSNGAPASHSPVVHRHSEEVGDSHNERTSSSSSWSSWLSKAPSLKSNSKQTASEKCIQKQRSCSENSVSEIQQEDKVRQSLPLLESPLLQSAPSSEGIRLSTVIGISGWVTKSPEDFTKPWRPLIDRSPSSDVFGMVWCTSELQALTSALKSLLAKGAAGQAARLGMQHLVVGGAGLVTALGPTVLLGAAAGLAIDNAWTTAGERADKAGKLLAHVLIGGGSGGRPVTLVAHSMGGRAAFSVLLELCRCGARGIVQDVVLLGAPVSTTEERWRMARRAVAGRLINGYSRKDWLLSTLYLPGVVRSPAGLAPIEVEGIENISLGSIVSGHFEYMERIDEIMEVLQVLSSE